MSNKLIGGFFELELVKGNSVFHENACSLNNGRSCFYLILTIVKPTFVYVPFYSCDSLLEPLNLLNIPFDFYGIDNNLEPILLPNLKESELLLYINYFGLKDNYVKFLTDEFRNQLVIDNTQAFFYGKTENAWSFNSARKYFGVPDGAFLYAPYNTNLLLKRNTQISMEHLVQRLLGNQEKAYECFKINEAEQVCVPFAMSEISEQILSGINYDQVSIVRKKNYMRYHAALSSFNMLQDNLGDNLSPFCYPLFAQEEIDKVVLAKKNIFIPFLWKEVSYREKEGYDFEKQMATNLLALPIDHRLAGDDIDRVIFETKILIDDANN